MKLVFFGGGGFFLKKDYRLFDQGLRETGGMNPFLPLILTVAFPQEKIHVFFLETGMSGKSNGEILIKNYTEV